MKTKKQHTTRSSSGPIRRIVLWTLFIAVILGLGLGARYVLRILTRPEALFVSATPAPTETPVLVEPIFPVEDLPTGAPVPDGRPAAGDGNILNVMLMGIDAYENGSTTSGSMPHTDVMMVIAINFDADTVDLITLPRDIMTTAPGHYGIYKLNGVFNVGLGGWSKPTGQSDELAEGFLLTCRAAEEWLGGITIPYYYGVDFQAVIDIVNAIGGIDYDVDQTFTSMSGRTYRKGMQHLDGDAVLGYLRIRRQADGLDSSRTARQRRMMVAIFNKLKAEGSLSQIPALISAANSGIYTNTTLAQTTALVNYARKLPADSIRTRSMFGEIGTIEYEWRYVYVDQQNRIDLIREVYGREVGSRGIDTRQYERWLHTVGFSAMKYMRQAEKVLKLMEEKKNQGVTFTDGQIALYGDCYRAYTALKTGFDEATDTLTPLYAEATWREKKSNKKNWTSENKAQDKELTALENDIQTALKKQMAASRDATVRLGDAIDGGKLSWSVREKWFTDPDINQVIVSFG